MRVTICGARGGGASAAAGGRYGGDSTCLFVRGAGGEALLLDAGSGVQSAARDLAAAPGERRLLILFTHYHLDHVLGLPTLPQLYDADWRVELRGPEAGSPAGAVSGRAAVERLVAPPFWPLTPQEMPATINWRGLDAGEIVHGGLRIRHCALNHPGGAVAYRVEEGEAAFVLATDMEWKTASPESRAALTALIREPFPARVLVCDGEYDDATYEPHRGWGHSTLEDAAAVAEATGVDELLVTHHALSADDAGLAARDARLGELRAGARLARQGETIEP